MKKRFFVLMLFCVYVFSSCSTVGYDTNAKFDSGYFDDEGNYVLNCKGIRSLAAACKTNLTDMDKVTRLVLKYADNTDIKGISKFKNLKGLALVRSDLADKDISFLNKNIESLGLFGCKNVDYTQIPDTISTLSLHYCPDIDPETISKLNKLVSLSMTYHNIDDPSKLYLLKQISTLEIIGDYDTATDMSYFSDLKNLAALRLYNIRAENFNAVSNLDQLEELAYAGSNTTYEDLSALSKLKILDTVSYYNQDYDQYYDINNPDSLLCYTSLFWNTVDSSISAIENMPDLQILRCIGYPGSKIKACKNLKEAMFTCEQVDLNDFDGLDKLEKLIVNINDIVPCKTNLKIKEFEYYDGNAKGDLSFIGNFTELEKLKIDYNNAFGMGTDMSYIGNCTKLKSLYIRDYDGHKKEVFDTSFISELKCLEELCIKHIIIQSTKPIGNLHKLKSLTLHGCCLCNIEAFSNLKSLEYVDLGRNMISDISPLANLKCISHLNLEHNKIKDISAVSGLEDIKYLDISYNDVKDVNAFSGLSNIEFLNLRKNLISDLTPISGKSKLKFLNISINEITDSAWAKDLNSLEELEAREYQTADLDFIYSFPIISKIDIQVNYEVIADLDQFQTECDVYRDSFTDCEVRLGYVSDVDVGSYFWRPPVY